MPELQLHNQLWVIRAERHTTPRENKHSLKTKRNLKLLISRGHLQLGGKFKAIQTPRYKLAPSCVFAFYRIQFKFNLILKRFYLFL